MSEPFINRRDQEVLLQFLKDSIRTGVEKVYLCRADFHLLGWHDLLIEDRQMPGAWGTLSLYLESGHDE